MATKGVLKSFRFGKAEADWLVNTSKAQGITQTDLLKSLMKQKDNRFARKSAISTVVQLETVEADDEVLQYLTSLGIGTASGLIGYHLAGWIREQMKLDEDKGIQIASGVLLGLGSVILHNRIRKKA